MFLVITDYLKSKKGVLKMMNRKLASKIRKECKFTNKLQAYLYLHRAENIEQYLQERERFLKDWHGKEMYILRVASNFKAKKRIFKECFYY